MNMSGGSTESNRLALSVEGKHWSNVVADAILERFPGLPRYTCAAGISPSGVVHFGNFRDVMTAVMVGEALRQRGKEVRLIFSWDDFDRFRKVPVGVPDSFAEHIGKPLSAVPDPEGELDSYAARFEEPFERAMKQLGIRLDFRYQTREYATGRYDDAVVSALRSRREIADVLLGFMSEKSKGEKGVDPVKYTEEYYPISLYSRFTGKDSTKILDFDGNATVTYRCLETGETESVNIREHHIVKLSWKIDWPMRWRAEEVVFEPGGADHASPGSSYDVSSAITRRIFHRPPPVFVGYQFIGLQGLDGKMSGSKGQAVSPGQLLEIYEEPLLIWLYARKTPDQVFNLAFNSEIFRQYDELDRQVASYVEGTLNTADRQTLELSFSDTSRLADGQHLPIPFRQAVGLGQILQWDVERVKNLTERWGQRFLPASIDARVPKARAWLETYNRAELIVLREDLNREHLATMNEEARGFIRTLRERLGEESSEIESLEELVYSIPKLPDADPKLNSKRQRAFFKDVYLLLIGKETGPRLSTFLWAVDREMVLTLLDIDCAQRLRE